MSDSDCNEEKWFVGNKIRILHLLFKFHATDFLSSALFADSKKPTRAEKDKKAQNQLSKKLSEVSNSDSGNESHSSAESDSDALSDSDSESESDSDSDSEGNVADFTSLNGPAAKKRKLNNANKDGFEVVSENMEGM